MCIVVAPAVMAAVSAAATIGSAAMAYRGQQQQVAAQNNYRQQVYQQQVQQAQANAEYQNNQVRQQNTYIQQNAENAMIALQADRQALVSREREEGLAIALDLEQKRMERLRAVGALQSSEKAGLTLENLMGDYYNQEARYRSISNQNLAFTSTQISREQDKLTAQARGRINDARPYQAAPIDTPVAPQLEPGPSFLGTALSTGSSLLGTFNNYSSYDAYSNRYRIGTGRLSQSTPSVNYPRLESNQYTQQTTFVPNLKATQYTYRTK